MARISLPSAASPCTAVCGIPPRFAVAHSWPTRPSAVLRSRRAVALPSLVASVEQTRNLGPGAVEHGPAIAHGLGCLLQPESGPKKAWLQAQPSASRSAARSRRMPPERQKRGSNQRRSGQRARFARETAQAGSAACQRRRRPCCAADSARPTARDRCVQAATQPRATSHDAPT
jgi:hypothetical protein